MATTLACTFPPATRVSRMWLAALPSAMPQNMKATPSPKMYRAFSLRRREASTNSTHVRMSKNSYPTLMMSSEMAA